MGPEPHLQTDYQVHVSLLVHGLISLTPSFRNRLSMMCVCVCVVNVSVQCCMVVWS